MNILLLPGFMNDETLWEKVRHHLETIGNLTFGDLSQERTIADMAKGVLDRAPQRFALVGFSMGGYVAREMARVAPERVERLVLIATSARADTERQISAKAKAVEQVRRLGFRGLSRATIGSSLAAQNVQNKELIESIHAMGERLGGDVFLRQASQTRESDLTKLKDISCPTLIIASRGDALRSFDEAVELEEGIPGSKLVTIEGAGHMIPMEAPGALADTVIGWLRLAR